MLLNARTPMHLRIDCCDILGFVDGISIAIWPGTAKRIVMGGIYRSPSISPSSQLSWPFLGHWRNCYTLRNLIFPDSPQQICLLDVRCTCAVQSVPGSQKLVHTHGDWQKLRSQYSYRSPFAVNNSAMPNTQPAVQICDASMHCSYYKG